MIGVLIKSWSNTRLTEIVGDEIDSNSDGGDHSHVRSRSPLRNMEITTNENKRITARRNAVNDSSKIQTLKELRNKLKDNKKMNENGNKNFPIKMAENSTNEYETVTETTSLDIDMTERGENKRGSDWNYENNEFSQYQGNCDNKNEQDCDTFKKPKLSNANTEKDSSKIFTNLHGAGYGVTKDDNDLYLETDMGPYFIHLALIDENEREICDLAVGLKMKQWKLKGIQMIKKISRREIKVIFHDRNSANGFIKSNFPNELKLKAYLPKYNIEKTGIIFDINYHYDENQIMEHLESTVPIVSIYRCLKRKIENGKKTKEWIKSNTVKVTFRSQVLPDEVTFGFSKRKVKQFVPNVIQCFKCLRFGHIIKNCKQGNNNCKNCGTQHDTTTENSCQKKMKCFHCHSHDHDALNRECPEYLRNQLIKETMIFKNMTYYEANDEFPRTTSCYRVAEKQQEFPALPNRQKQRHDPEERNERSYPKKSAQDLTKQYNDYLLLNQGKKPAINSTTAESQSYSSITKMDKPMKNTQSSNETSLKYTTTKQGNAINNRNQERIAVNGKNDDPDSSLALIHALNQKLQNSFLDSDQTSGGQLSNDLVLIDITRMIMDFIQSSNRKVVSYSDQEVSNHTNDEQ